jgi:tRNA-2-methylthio-N6-dimethylallyladenosine synthase
VGEVIARRRDFTVGMIAIVGCMATVRGDEIRRRFPQVKLILPATEHASFEDRVISAWPHLVTGAPGIRASGLEGKYERFVPIIRGCANRCTYCIVPSARGGEIVSRPPQEIISEIEGLIDEGVKSINLLGQNVCAYGKDSVRPAGWEHFPGDFGFPDLLEKIRDRFADKDVWFKFLTSHPRDVTEELINVVSSHPCFSHHFHLPLQAGDDDVLRRMGRGYTPQQYRALIEMIRGEIPDMRLTTDLIVGFPGEDGAAFERTLEMVREIGFDAAFTFLYSPRSGTPAFEWADPVPQPEKKRRLQALIELQNRITLERARKHVGRETPVLIEGPATGASSRGKKMLAGRTREEEMVILPGDGDDDEIGKIVQVRIIEARQRSFVAERIPRPDES